MRWPNDGIYLFRSPSETGNFAGAGAKEGRVKIKRKDGQIFVIRPETRVGSPLHVEGIDLDITKDEIVQFVQEGSHIISPPPPGSARAAADQNRICR